MALVLLILSVCSHLASASGMTSANDDSSQTNTHSGGHSNGRGRSGARTLPHLVLMIVDELGTGDVPWSDHTIHAPTIDKLAADGLRLGTM